MSPTHRLAVRILQVGLVETAGPEGVTWVATPTRVVMSFDERSDLVFEARDAFDVAVEALRWARGW